MVSLLALAILFQQPGFAGARYEDYAAPPEGTTVILGRQVPDCVGAPGGELEFARAVEESIAAEPKSAPPRAFRDLIAAMGADHWKQRDEAARVLEAAVRLIPEDARWLWWAAKDSDLEIRQRAVGVLKRLNPCTSCGGSGQSKNWPGSDCWDCEATRTEWRRSMFD